MAALWGCLTLSWVIFRGPIRFLFLLLAPFLNDLNLLVSEPSALLLPAESENFELATEITPSVVLSVVGVKVAV